MLSCANRNLADELAIAWEHNYIFNNKSFCFFTFSKNQLKYITNNKAKTL